MKELYYGDNLEVLRGHINDESVDLCYIDPPFNSKRNYNQIYNNVGKEDKAQAQAFIDTWEWDRYAIKGLKEIEENETLRNGRKPFTEQSRKLILGLKEFLGEGSLLAYLISMTLRIVEIHRVLKRSGSFYLHCDSSASHYLKIILDSIFCSQGGDFVNEIIWQRTSSHNDSKKWGNVHDVILFYSKSQSFLWNYTYTDHEQKYVDNFYKYEDERGMYRLDHIIRSASMGARPNLSYEYKGYTPQWGWRTVREKLEVLDSEGRLSWSSTGRPYLKRYLHEQKGTPIKSVITDIPPISPKAAEKLGYPTQKPEALLERIIKASSNKNDVVLDAYCGCGTTVAVAERLERNWIGIDITYQSISLILKRLEDSEGKRVSLGKTADDDISVDIMDSVVINGIPKDLASAEALANKKDDRTRKEFEKWAVLTYSNNKGVINEKKGADKGIDGFAYFKAFDVKENTLKTEKIVFQVKSGKVKSGDIRDLRGTMEREKAVLGVFITLQEPTKDMLKEAMQAGTYQNESMSQPTDKIRIVTAREIIEEKKRLDISQLLTLDVLKSATKSARSEQLPLEYEPLTDEQKDRVLDETRRSLQDMGIIPEDE